MAEGAPLLREYGVYSLIEGSNPSVSASIFFAGLLVSFFSFGVYKNVMCEYAPVFRKEVFIKTQNRSLKRNYIPL